MNNDLDNLALDPVTRAAVQNMLEQARAKVAAAQEEQRRQQTVINTLQQELALLRRWRFGRSSEQLSAHQMSIFDDLNGDEAALLRGLDAAQADTVVTDTAPAKPARQTAGRQPLPADLPRVDIRHEPASCQCGQCGRTLVQIGEDVSEKLNVIPARFEVQRHIRPQYACRHCETVTAAPVAPAVIDGSLAATGLLVWVIIGKYLDHLPLYRLEQMALRSGVTLARSTLASWVGQVGWALQPLAERLVDILKQREVIHADETPVRQLDPGSGKTHQSYLWVYRSGDWATGPPTGSPPTGSPPTGSPSGRIVVFDYQASRRGAHAQSLLSGWSGHLVVDDFAGYKALFDGKVIEVGCMAHARRKFFDLNTSQPSAVATEALRRIGELYRIEADVRELSSAKRQEIRVAEALPRLIQYHQWLVEIRNKVPDGSTTAKAMDYTLRRWESLSRYAHTGNLPIDNNAVENALRPVALGRKNWLFVGSQRAGERAAAIMSLLQTAKLNGLDPAAWLYETLEKLPSWPNRRIDELLPLRQN